MLASLGKITTRWSLIGLVSLGPKDCGGDKKEGELENTIFVNTNNMDYQKWIKTTIENNTKNMTGSYCHEDLEFQCVKCDDSYKLINQKCVQEFTYDQMSSVYSFFENTFCADHRCRNSAKLCGL